uniref:Membrane-associated tyrosine- and threonine-specific cdc2-inhibitory kinase wee-1.3 n=2 Tax=Meloidogyne incognita group TaxID=654580 RepID=A0A914MS55_MELIC
MKGTPDRGEGGFITPSRCSPTGKFMFDKPLSTKREKLLRGTPSRYKIPQAPRLMKSAPNVQRYSLIRAHIEPFARIVSFKSPTERPRLSPFYHPDTPETYLEQRFNMHGRLGRGDFGEVVSVRSKDDGKAYAIKCAIEVYRNIADRREKLQEVLKHEMLPPHPNLVHFFKAWEEKGRLYIQTELCCRSLDDVARERHEIGEPEIWYYLIDILMALEHMHSHDLIHVDIKPSNIFITSDGICKLGDFGLVFDLNKDDPKNVMEGDGKYLAAEVLNDKPTKAADIFSLGMTILELATDLDLPNNGVFWHEIRNRMIDEKYIKVLSTDLRRVIAWMIDPCPLNRPKAIELLKDPFVSRYRSRRQIKLLKHRAERTPEFNLASPPFTSNSPVPTTPSFRQHLDFDDKTYSENETGLSPPADVRMNVSLPSRSTVSPSPLARFTGSGNTPPSSRSRKRGPRAGDELFGIERRFLRTSKDSEEKGDNNEGFGEKKGGVGSD